MVKEATPDTLRAYLTSGVAYGFTAVLLSHPFDTIKTRQQCAGTSTGLAVRMGSVLSTILRTEGPSALFKGFAPAAAGSMLFRAVPFAVYNFSGDALRSRSQWLAAHPISLAAVAGGSAGIARSLFECPTDVAKIRWQTNQGVQVGALYQGLGLTVIRNMGMISIFWATWESSKHQREQVCCGSAPLSTFVGGAGCSVVSWICVFPLDVLKTRCQSQSSPRGVFQLGAQIVRHQGVAALYSGISAGLLRTVIANGGAMVVYDFFLQRSIAG